MKRKLTAAYVKSLAESLLDYESRLEQERRMINGSLEERKSGLVRKDEEITREMEGAAYSLNRERYAQAYKRRDDTREEFEMLQTRLELINRRPIMPDMMYQGERARLEEAFREYLEGREEELLELSGKMAAIADELEGVAVAVDRALAKLEKLHYTDDYSREDTGRAEDLAYWARMFRDQYGESGHENS